MLNMRLSAVPEEIYQRAVDEILAARLLTIHLLLAAGCEDNEVRAYMRHLDKEAN